MGERGSAIVQILSEAHRSIGGNRAPAFGEPLLVDVTGSFASTPKA